MGHVILVAFEVHADNMEHAQRQLMEKLLPEAPFTESHNWLDCWWIAEDERYDRSDLDSAVFVPPGLTQRHAHTILRHTSVVTP